MANVLTTLPGASRMPPALLAWAPILLALLAIYLPTYGYLAEYTWTQEEHAHGPMILLAAAFLAWQKRQALLAAAAEPRPLLGWPLLILGVLLHALGRSQEVIIFAVASQIPVLVGMLLLSRGVPAVRALWFPLFFLVFMIPLPGFLVDSATAALKQQVSQVAEQVLYALDYPIARSGVTLSIGPYQLLVADACSGLHSMFSLSAVGLLYIHVMRYSNWLRNGLLIAAILPIAFAANVARVLILSLVTYHYGSEAGLGFLHDIASLVLFAVAILLIAALDAVLGMLLPGPAKASSLAPQQAAPAAPAGRATWARHLLIGLAILTAMPLGMAMTPRQKVADLGPKLDLEAVIPTRFGSWVLDPQVVPLQADPETTAMLDRLYNQILSRTYVNDQGQRVMLLIAYGGDQSEAMQVHAPEVCYPAQGYRIVEEGDAHLDTGLGAIPVRRMVAVLGPRVEPVTYWTTIGDKIARGGGGSWKLEQMKYGLTGKIPDGLLFRISTIARDAETAYRDQAQFVRDLLSALPAKDRARFIGHPGQ